jgi:hypothetical protein
MGTRIGNQRRLSTGPPRAASSALKSAIFCSGWAAIQSSSFLRSVVRSVPFERRSV